jgi:hypothetical protein
MNNFPDIHVNFTVFTMMPFNSTVPSEQYFRDSFNKTLARDSVAILQECVIQPIEKNSTESVRNSLLERMQSVRYILFVEYFVSVCYCHHARTRIIAHEHNIHNMYNWLS